MYFYSSVGDNSPLSCDLEEISETALLLLTINRAASVRQVKKIVVNRIATLIAFSIM